MKFHFGRFLFASLLLMFFFAACSGDGLRNPVDSDANSSSSKKKVSSSSEESSSSTGVPPPCKTEDSDKCEYGSVVDKRDGKTYKTVKIGNQWWFAENLNYDVPNSVCYGDKESNCEKYGRLYRWQEAVKGACPEGWFLPSFSDFEELMGTLGYVYDPFALMSRENTEWSEARDDYGFSAMMGGIYRRDDDNPENSFIGEGQFSHFWREEGGGSEAHLIWMNPDVDNVGTSNTFFYSEKNSVRCIKDENRDNFVQPCKTDSTDTCDYGTFTDERDGQTYKTVTIGKHTWMAENLNYEVENSWCYDNDPEKCKANGRLYSKAASLDACPSGWRLPGLVDWNVLARMTGFDEQDWVVTGLEEWPDATDAYGLSILPAGSGNVSGTIFANEGALAYFFCALDGNECQYEWFMNSWRMDFQCVYDKEIIAIRCVKD